MIIPSKLKKGDIVGVVAPSDPITEDKLEDINKSILLMEKFGFKIQFASNIFCNSLGYSATVKEKASDINNMFQSSNIKAIFCCTGGNNSNSLFEYLDYDIIRKNPKIICGFSDSTSILNMIYQKTGLVTFHGPTFKSLTSWQTDYGYKEVIKRFIDKDLTLGQNDDIYINIRDGQAQGKLVGGNLRLISDLTSGNFKIDFSNKILFIEDLGFETPPAMISHCLYKMKQDKIFDEIKGIWIGNYEHTSGIKLEKILLDVLEEKYRFPIIKSNNFGHLDRKTVIPIGINAKIDTNKTIKIELLEECVK
ncbi:MAG: LD-carboxypeptidase [Clostridia bacterium]|jgi:muramoyltetrapeptide carboxypeptidase|nr:LD-carboxypeptidase [Clostridia bacterium]